MTSIFELAEQHRDKLIKAADRYQPRVPPITQQKKKNEWWENDTISKESTTK